MMLGNQGRFQRFFPMTLAQNLDEKASKTYIALKNKEFDEGMEYTFALGKTDGDKVCGLVILKDIDPKTKRGEIAYCIGKAYTGRGWTTRAVTQFSQYAFRELGLATLEILVHESNLASIRVAEKSGFTYRKTLKASYTPPGEKPLDMLLFERSKNR